MKKGKNIGVKIVAILAVIGLLALTILPMVGAFI